MAILTTDPDTGEPMLSENWPGRRSQIGPPPFVESGSTKNKKLQPPDALPAPSMQSAMAPPQPPQTTLPPNVVPPTPDVSNMPLNSSASGGADPVMAGAPNLPMAPNPKVFGPAHWWNLTRREDTGGPGVDPDTQQRSYRDASIDPTTGQPSINNPSLTKLGKVLTILRGAGMGAMAGGAQPDFFHGAMAAQQNANQQTQQFQEQQQRAVGLQQAKQNLGLVQTPWGPMPMSIAKLMLPADIRGQYGIKTANIGAEAKRDVADTAALSREQVAGIHGMVQLQVAGAQGTPLTPELAKEFNFPPEMIGKRVKLSDITAARNADARANVPMMTSSGLVTIDKSKAAHGLPSVRRATDEEGRTYASAALAMPTAVGDPNNPGDTVMVPRGQSFGMPGPTSASVSVPRDIQRSEVPTKAGDQRVGFQTMIDHAGLLRTAMTALENGDNQTWNGMKNRWKTEFGYSGPLTAEAIADAYKGEVSSVINKGHITDTGSEKVAHTLDPVHMNYDTMDSILNAYQGLAQSKMNNLDRQQQRARQGAQRTNRPGGGAAPPPAPTNKHSDIGFVPR